MRQDDVRSFVAAHFAAMRALDLESWVATFAADGIRYDPERTTSGHHALRRFFDGLTSAFESLEIEPERIFTTGSRAAVSWTGRGRRRGRDVTFEGIDFFEFDGVGKIAVLSAYWDAGAVLVQLQGGVQEGIDDSH